MSFFFCTFAAAKVCMSFLLLILSVMTWTVKDKSTVSGEGSWPYDIEVSYSNSYQKGSVRAGDEAVLRLGHLEGITVQQVELSMRSNKSAGAGIISVQFDGAEVAHKEGTFAEWTGAYDADEFHTITMVNTPYADIDEIRIVVTGTTNSLYIESYTIYYANGGPHTLTLMQGGTEYDELTESAAGAGVILPVLPDTANWHFIGWSPVDIGTVTVKPYTIAARTRYYPGNHDVLWAVYTYLYEHDDAYVTDLQSGVYTYSSRDNNIAIAGVPVNGKMAFADLDVTDPDQQYYVAFNETLDSATIMHVPSGIYIGYEGKKLDTHADWWQVYHAEDVTAFYTVFETRTYVLLPYIIKGTEEMYAGLFLTSDVSNSPTGLKAAREKDENYYTCHPEDPWGVPTIPVATRTTVIPMGVYDLIIQDGKKMIRLKE